MGPKVEVSGISDLHADLQNMLRALSSIYDAISTFATSGTVSPGTGGQVAWYATTGSTVSGNSNANISNGGLTLGAAASVAGSLTLMNAGALGVGAKIQNLGTTSAWNFNLPTTAGTSGQALVSAGGGSSNMTWAGFVSSTLASAHIFVGNVSNVATDVAASGDVTLANTGAFTVAKVNGVSYGTSPATGTIPVVTGTNATAYQTLTASGIPSNANLLENGGFLIDQSNEGASLTVASSTTIHTADRWIVNFQNGGSAAGSPTIQQQNISSQPDATTDFVKSLLITSNVTTGTTAAGLQLKIRQYIEGPTVASLGFGTANAQSVTITIYLKTSLTGTNSWSVALINSASNRSYVHLAQTVAANTWAKATWTVPGDTSGTWLTALNAIGMNFYVAAAVGANNGGSTPDTWSAAGAYGATGQTILTNNSSATLEISPIKMEVGNTATPYVELPAEVLFERCRRCYQKTFLTGTAPAQNVASVVNAITVKNPIALGDPSVYWQLDPPMTTMVNSTPTVTTYNPSAGNANWRDITAGADATVSVDPATTKGPNGVLIATSGTVTTLGDVLAIHATADAGC